MLIAALQHVFGLNDLQKQQSNSFAYPSSLVAFHRKIVILGYNHPNRECLLLFKMYMDVLFRAATLGSAPGILPI